MSKLITDVGFAPLTTSRVGVGTFELAGPIPPIRDDHAPLQLKKDDKVRICAVFFKKAAPVAMGAALTVTLTSSYAALKATNPPIAKYSWAAAISSISIIPHTMALLKPPSEGLRDAAQKRDLTASEGQEM